MEEYDAIIIGSGQSGGPLATALAGAGRKTVLIESRYVGGTCINYGCTPTKTMVASADMANRVRRSAEFGVETRGERVDMPKIRERKNQMVESFRAGTLRRIKNGGEDFIKGTARFTGPKTLEVELEGGGTRQMTGKQIFINAGGRPLIPNLEGLDQVPYLTSTSIMDLDQVPAHLLILGGGYVALEFGQMFRRFGSRVTLVERSGQLLSREDPDVAQGVLKILQEDGIEVLLNTEARAVRKTSGGEIQLDLQTPGEARSLTGSHLLLAVGRVPNSDGLNLAAAGITTDERGNISVNDRLETKIGGVYAMGDIKGGPAFTHISYDDYRILKKNLLEGGHASTRGRMVPYTVFIDPQLARIGLSESEARSQGLKIQVARLGMDGIARTVEIGETRGFMKAVVDADTGQILGASILGVDGGEIMAMIEIAMLGKLPYTVLRDGIFAHPTLAEAMNNLFSTI
jgi:pyruvate/2-oxoglutarate dehydrogenase complex dihydrolipoamide dehydrogenase (E3) component